MKRALFDTVTVLPFASGNVVDRTGYESAVLAVTVEASQTATIKVETADSTAGPYEPVKDSRMLMLREDAEAIAQNVRNNLLTWKGEFPLNTDHGTDWERVVQQPRSEAVDEADSVVRSSIFQEPYVQEISSLSMTADGRALGVEFSGVLYNGKTIRVEVNTGG